MAQRHIVFDTETTGLDPASGHRVVEVGCVELIDYLPTGNAFHRYINPQRDMPPEAEKVHGLSATFLNDKPLFKEISREFLAFVNGDPLVAHNAAFDMKFINAELIAAGHNAIDPATAIDTVKIARRKFPGAPASLDALCRRFGVDLSVRTKHGALLDAELLAEVYLELMGGRQSSFGLGSAEPSISAQKNGQGGLVNQQIQAFPRRHFAPSQAEQEAHQAFIREQLSNPIWEEYESACS